MLVSNPDQRITTEQILKHPWLDFDVEGDEDTYSTEDNALVNAPLSASSKELSSSWKKTVSRKGSTTNLIGTLRQLSGHISDVIAAEQSGR
eukprot:gene32276-41830_t